MAVEFKVGDNAYYPAHGVGEITDTMKRKLGGKEREFYSLKIYENGMKIMVPVETAEAVGLRRLLSKKDVKRVYEIFKSEEVAVKTQPWNRRYREYMDMLKSGSPFDVAQVLRDLFRLKSEKELSFGERRLLDTASNLLVTELSLVMGKDETAVKEEVEALF